MVLVCPRDFANQPVASLLDVRKQLLVLRRQLDRMARIDALLDAVPADFTADLAADPADAWSPRCPGSRPATRRSAWPPASWRTSAGTRRAGTPARWAARSARRWAASPTVAEVLALAAGERAPDPGQGEAAALLRAAARLRADALTGNPA